MFLAKTQTALKYTQNNYLSCKNKNKIQINAKQLFVFGKLKQNANKLKQSSNALKTIISLAKIKNKTKMN